MALTTYPSYAEFFCVPGLFYVEPSSLTTEASYGTLLGWLDGPGIAEYYQPTEQVANHLGVDPVREYLTGRPFWRLKVRVLNRSLAALQAAFPGQVTNTGGDTKNVVTPGPSAASAATFLPGENLVSTDYCKRIMMMPEDEGLYHPIWLAQFALGKQVGTVEHGVAERVLNLEFHTYDRPSSTSAYRRFFDGNKTYATLLA